MHLADVCLWIYISFTVIAVTKAEETLQGNLFKRTTVGTCLTNIQMTMSTLKTEYSIGASHCALICENKVGCSKFLYCPLDGKNCYPIGAMGTRDRESRRLNCSCYKMINPRCENGGHFQKHQCHCLKGFYGSKCEFIVQGCQEAQAQHIRGTEATFVKPQNAADLFPVVCDIGDSHAYTVIQQRRSVSDKFPRDRWKYQRGFGTLKHNFWLGFDQITALLGNRSAELQIELLCDIGRTESFQISTFRFDNFSLAGETDGYRIGSPLLDISNASQNAELANTFLQLVGTAFSTSDHDFSGKNCSKVTDSAWWFGADCSTGNLNLPLTAQRLDPQNNTINYITWKLSGFYVDIIKTQMKIKV